MLRPVCYRCLRAGALCTCELFTALANRTEVVILQHERERRHPLGTARLAHLALSRSRLLVCGTRAPTPRPDLPAGAALLFPSADARPLAAGQTLPALVVLDGTWPQARALYRANPWLQQLPHVRIDRDAPSGYRIRREPRAGYLSTLEAVVDALRLLEPDTRELERVLAAFHTMIDRQIERGRQKRVRRRLKRRRGGRSLPAVLGERERLVVAHAEHFASSLVYLVAHRPGRGETRAWLVRGASRPTDRHLEQMGLVAADWSGALDPGALGAAWRSLVRPDDVVAAWSDSTFALLPVPAERKLPLKPAFCNLHRGPTSHLESLVERLKLPVPSLPVEGRAQARLGAAVAITAYLADRVAPSGAVG